MRPIQVSHSNIKMPTQLNINKDFDNLCEWIVDHKISVHFGEDKTKCILVGSKQKLKNTVYNV